jgi:hypothetical protein
LRNRRGPSFRYTSAFDRAPGDLVGESSETPVLEDAHRPRALAHDRSNLARFESADHAKQDHLSLVSREARTNQSDGGLGPDRVESSRGRVIVGGGVQDLGSHGDAGSSRLMASPVDEAIPRDREHPRLELPFVPIEVGEVSSGYEPGFGFDILRSQLIEPAQEAQQPWMQLSPQHGDRLVRTLPGGLENVGEFGRRHVSRCLAIRSARRPARS